MMKLYKMTIFVLISCCSTLLWAQNKKISGSIREGNEPLVGAVIMEKGLTNNSTASDAKGNFTLQLRGNGDVLVIRSIGFKTQEINLAGKTTVVVNMTPDITGLDEVVVVGYGTMLRKDLTGSIASLKGEELAAAGTSSFQEALQGRLSGVQVIASDATPGGGVQIKIRGGSTLTAGNQPLYVIDGFPITPDFETDLNPLSDINPSDIASVEVLKDASATAIYGAEGANGVILITTKQGKKGSAPVIEASTYVGMSKLNGDAIQVMQGQQYIDYKLQTLVQTVQFKDAVTSWQLQDPAKGQVWMDRIVQSGRAANGDVGIRGGSAQGLYYSTNVNYYHEDGILKNSNYERFTARTNLDQEVGKKLKFGVKMFYSKVVQDGFMNEYSRESSIFKKAMVMSPFSSGKPTTGRDFTAEEEENNYDDNLTSLLTDAIKIRNLERIQPSFTAQYQVLKNLDFNTVYGFDKLTQNFDNFYPSSTRSGFSAGGRANLLKGNSNSWYYNARLNYRYTVKKHKFDALAVFETKGKTKYNYTQDASNFTSEALNVKNLQMAQTLSKPFIDEAEEGYISYISRINYNYADRYLATVTYRRDGSSKFGNNNKWADFPAVGLAWRVDEEQFMKGKTPFSSLKIRLGWGVTGNSQIGAYSSLARLNPDLYVNGNDLVNTLIPTALGNEELKWETTTQQDIGLDIGILKERITLTADAYLKKTTDLLLNVDLPNTTGYTRAIQNIGSIQNKGLEFAINTVNTTGRLKWSTNFNISFNRSKILSLGESDQQLYSYAIAQNVTNNILIRRGSPIGVYYGFIGDGVYNTLTEVENSPGNSAIPKTGSGLLGEMKFVDVNADGIINDYDRVPLAYTEPKFLGGLINNFSYSGFDMTVVMRWSYGNDLINGNIGELNNLSPYTNNLVKNYENMWLPGRPESNYVGFNRNGRGGYMHSEYVEDGSFLRVDRIAVGYTFPKKLLSNLKVSKLRVYMNLRNALLFTNYSWYDPEVSTGDGTGVSKLGPGADLGAYPRTRQFQFGLNVTL